MAIRFVERKPARQETVVEAAISEAEMADPKGPDAVPAGFEAPVDGLLPGLTEPARPRKRRRGRMMGFG